MPIVQKSTPEGMPVVQTRYASCPNNLLLVAYNQRVIWVYKDTIIYPLKDYQFFNPFSVV
jgi:hypothetical protein